MKDFYSDGKFPNYSKLKETRSVYLVTAWVFPAIAIFLWWAVIECVNGMLCSAWKGFPKEFIYALLIGVIARIAYKQTIIAGISIDVWFQYKQNVKLLDKFNAEGFVQCDHQ